MKILVIQQKMIGDVLISSIICENIKLWNPKIEVDFLVNRHTIPVIENNPHIDNIIIFEDHKSDRRRNFLKFLKMHKNKDYDIIIDAYGKIESIIITLLTNAKIKIGYKKWYTKWVYSILIDRKLRKSKAEIQLSILNRLKLLEPIVGKNFKFKLKPTIHLKQEREKNIDLISIKKKNMLTNWNVALIGNGSSGLMEKIGGKEVSYLKSRLETYRSGKKIGPNSALMIMMASELSDVEIQNLAAYLASVQNNK